MLNKLGTLPAVECDSFPEGKKKAENGADGGGKDKEIKENVPVVLQRNHLWGKTISAPMTYAPVFSQAIHRTTIAGRYRKEALYNGASRELDFLPFLCSASPNILQ